MTEKKLLMKSNIPKDKIEVLKIAKHSKYFQRIQENEFRFHGKMYDVIREVPAKGFTIYYCINDKQEEQLMKSYSKLFETSNDGMTTVKFSGKILKNIFFPVYFEKKNAIATGEITNHEYLTHRDKCLTCFYDVEIPPPKLVSVV